MNPELTAGQCLTSDHHLMSIYLVTEVCVLTVAALLAVLGAYDKSGLALSFSGSRLFAPRKDVVRGTWQPSVTEVIQ